MSKCYLIHQYECYVYPPNSKVILNHKEKQELLDNHSGKEYSCFSGDRIHSIDSILFAFKFVIRYDGNLIGYGVLVDKVDYYYLCNLCTFSKARSKGIMRRCLRFILSNVFMDKSIQLKVDKKNKYNLHTKKHPNGKVYDFYLSLGFKKKSEDRFNYVLEKTKQ